MAIVSPESVTHLFQTATRNHQSGRLKEAETTYRAVLSFQPEHPYCLQQFGMLLAQLGRQREAVAPMEKSVRVRSDIPAFWNNLGEIYRQVNRLVEAMQAFHQALRLQIVFPEAHYNLANVLKQLGRHGEAVTHYQEAVRLRPDYDRAWYNLGNTLREEGRVVPAVTAYRKAIQLKPDYGDAHLNLANALYDQRDLENAAIEYRRAIELKPDDPDLKDSLGNCLVAAGRIEEAKAIYASTSRSEKWLRSLRSDLLALPVAPDQTYIEEYRLSVSENLKRYADRASIDVVELHTSGAEPPMVMAYHGRDDRQLKEQFSRFFGSRLPACDPPPARTGKPSIGVVVTHGHEGVFARCLGELIARLDRNQMDLRMITSRAGANIVNLMLPDAKFEYLLLPDRVDQANELLRETGFDVLLYWEVGTDSMNYFLPMFRPARMQATCWGWPMTSGHSAVSDYLSWDRLEPEDADSHYTEKLTRLTHMPTYYVRPNRTLATRTKESMGFSATERLYLCQQNVRKYHPEFDGVLTNILQRDPAGVIGIIADEQPVITEILIQRLRGTMPGLADRLRVIERKERLDYLELVSVSDVVLDTPHYGGGANTILDAVAVGTPVVTWQGPFQRGRWAAAVNRMLGLPELIADQLPDYARIAVDIATNPDRRKFMHDQICRSGNQLFEDKNAVSEWEEWLLKASGQSQLL